MHTNDFFNIIKIILNDFLLSKKQFKIMALIFIYIYINIVLFLLNKMLL